MNVRGANYMNIGHFFHLTADIRERNKKIKLAFILQLLQFLCVQRFFFYSLFKSLNMYVIVRGATVVKTNEQELPPGI